MIDTVYSGVSVTGVNWEAGAAAAVGSLIYISIQEIYKRKTLHNISGLEKKSSVSSEWDGAETPTGLKKKKTSKRKKWESGWQTDDTCDLSVKQPVISFYLFLVGFVEGFFFFFPETSMSKTKKQQTGRKVASLESRGSGSHRCWQLHIWFTHSEHVVTFWPLEEFSLVLDITRWCGRGVAPVWPGCVGLDSGEPPELPV